MISDRKKLLLLLSATAMLALLRLGSYDLAPPNEPRFAEVAREMMQKWILALYPKARNLRVLENRHLGSRHVLLIANEMAGKAVDGPATVVHTLPKGNALAISPQYPLPQNDGASQHCGAGL